MARHNSLALLALGASAAACAPMDYNVAPPNMGLTPIAQPVVQRTDYVLDLNAAGGAVPSSELGRLAAWFDSLQLRYGDRVSIDSPYRDAGISRDVAGVAASYGLLLSDGAPVTAGQVQPGSVRVVVSRMTASVPGCPNWSGAPYGASSATSSNFGCAMNSNLAAMVADPGDLVLGQTGDRAGDADTASKAVKLYREAKPTAANGLEKTTTTGGN